MEIGEGEPEERVSRTWEPGGDPADQPAERRQQEQEPKRGGDEAGGEDWLARGGDGERGDEAGGEDHRDKASTARATKEVLGAAGEGGGGEGASGGERQTGGDQGGGQASGRAEPQRQRSERLDRPSRGSSAGHRGR